MSNTTTPSISSGSSSNPSTNLTTPSSEPICTVQHALYCFDVLLAYFEDREPIDPPFDNADEKYALFVTWNTRSHLRSNKKPALRGCIGNFSPMTLAKGLREYALISALEDHRFSPIKATELPLLSCNVSLLTPFTPIPDPLAWTPGIHGIHLTFPSPTTPTRTLSATYLPEICPDQGWSREETVLSAVQKAGYRGKVKVGDKVWESLKVKVYGSEKSSTDWEEFAKWKEGRGEQVVIALRN
ncbi:hypothetical protein CI109_100699 [Kwoniella shandongensis]|uniref:Uncharacterized protein n=1 Tax=Kwoniella shandongensis TaxID=1734106 RepID=A0A5M6C2E5_9TREE|nr:uncharacterized protein CI109_003380 [Kwoniella shandongensis]KAA5528092.1 hypothetical protein CI109_003380 [Kwoniella shandongensis]